MFNRPLVFFCLFLLGVFSLSLPHLFETPEKVNQRTKTYSQHISDPSDSTTDVGRTDIRVAIDVVDQGGSAATQSRHVSAIERMVPSALAGITPPALQWSQDGSLLPQYASRAWLEFFRSVPTEQAAQARAYQQALLEQMTLAQREQLQALQRLYLQVLEEVGQFQASYESYGVNQELQLAMTGGSGSDEAWQQVEKMVAETQQIRRQRLGESLVDAWFADDEAVELYTVAALSIARDQSLDDRSKGEQVAALDYMLPQQVRQSVQLSRRSSELAANVNQWQSDGWSEAEITQAISLQYGSDVADRWQQAGSQL